jgi:hypothetical protein
VTEEKNTSKTIRERMRTRGIPGNLLGSLASEPNALVYASDVTDWAKGRPIAAAKAARLLNKLTEIESWLDWIAKTENPTPDLSDVASVELALLRWKSFQTARVQLASARVAPTIDALMPKTDKVLSDSSV